MAPGKFRLPLSRLIRVWHPLVMETDNLQYHLEQSCHDASRDQWIYTVCFIVVVSLHWCITLSIGRRYQVRIGGGGGNRVLTPTFPSYFFVVAFLRLFVYWTPPTLFCLEASFFSFCCCCCCCLSEFWGSKTPPPPFNNVRVPPIDTAMDCLL